MERIKEQPLVHLFICTRSKDKGESCGPKGGAELREKLKKWSKNEGISKEVKVTASLCLSQCEDGIAGCIYPQNKWFIKLDKDEDLETMKDEVLKLLKKARE